MSATELKIRIYGDPVLRKKALAVGEISEEHGKTLSRMARLMYASSGIGLAAPQVGILEKMVVIDIGFGLYKLINPRVVKKEGSQVIEEGCLSVPGVCIKIRRAKKILVKAQDELGRKIDINAEGLLACVFQHEIDHLSGRLIVDHASFLKNLRIKKRLEELKKKAKDEGMSQSKTDICQLQL